MLFTILLSILYIAYCAFWFAAMVSATLDEPGKTALIGIVFGAISAVCWPLLLSPFGATAGGVVTGWIVLLVRAIRARRAARVTRVTLPVARVVQR